MSDTTAPEIIFLQVGDDDRCNYKDAMAAGADISWCQDQIFDQDVKYVRADLVRTMSRSPANQQTVSD